MSAVSIAPVLPIHRVLGALLDPPRDLFADGVDDGAGTTGLREESEQAGHDCFVAGRSETFSHRPGVSVLDQLDRDAPLRPIPPDMLRRYHERMAEMLKPFVPRRRRR